MSSIKTYLLKISVFGGCLIFYTYMTVADELLTRFLIESRGDINVKVLDERTQLEEDIGFRIAPLVPGVIARSIFYTFLISVIGKSFNYILS